MKLNILLGIVYMVLGVLSLLFMRMVYKKKTTEGNLLALAVAIASVPLFSYALISWFTNPTLRKICFAFVFISVDFIMLTLCAFAHRMSDYNVPKKVFVILLSLCCVDSALILYNIFDEIMVSYVPVVVQGFEYWKIVGKPLYVAHRIFAYGLVFYFFMIFVHKCTQIAHVYSRRYLEIMFWILLIASLNILAAFSPVTNLFDIAIVFYPLYAVILYYYAFIYRSTMLINKTRAMLPDYIATPILFFDNNDLLVSINENSVMNLPVKKEDEYAITLEEFEHRLGKSVSGRRGAASAATDISISKNLKTYYYHVDYSMLSDKRGRFFGKLFVFHDFTKQNEMYNTLEQLANYDSLTGLHNKHHFQNTLIDIDRSGTLPVSLATCDINGLKAINSIFGESMGDHVIWYVANVFSLSLPREVYTARLEGDETVIVLPGYSEAETICLLQPIIARIENEHSFEFELNVEFGVATKEDNESNTYQLLDLARNSMSCKKMLNRKSVKSSLVESLMKSLSQSDFETEEHCERVKALSRTLGEHVGLSDGELGSLNLLALLHDIGKLAIPSQILNKPTSLTKKEWEIMKQHTIRGFNIANTAEELKDISQYILCHHERWDGKGYPNGIAGEEIPKLSRILTIVDSYDVMTHDRPYHKAMTVKDAISEIQACSGTQFDPELADIFITMVREDSTKSHDQQVS